MSADLLRGDDRGRVHGLRRGAASTSRCSRWGSAGASTRPTWRRRILSVVTSISLDHVEDLGGDDRGDRLREGRRFPARAGPRSWRAGVPEALGVFDEAAARTGARLHAGGRGPLRRPRPFRPRARASRSRRRRRSYALATPLPGAHQAENAAVAVRAAELLRAADPARARRRRTRRRVGPLAGAPREILASEARTGAPGRLPQRRRRRGARALPRRRRPARPTSSSARWRTRTSRRWAGRSLPPSGGSASCRRRTRLGRAPPEELLRRFSPGRARRARRAAPRGCARRAARRSRGRIYNRRGIPVPGRRGALAAPLRPVTRKGLDDHGRRRRFTREHFERLEEERLAIFASKSARASRPRGAAPPNPGDARTDYARDRDRIIHSRAFRRLKHKTQVFIPYEGDHFRTRLTHTIEVAQIAPQRRAGAGAERGSDRGDRPRPRSRPHAVRPLGRVRARPAAAREPSGRRRLQAQLPVRSRRRPAREALRGARPEPDPRRARGDAQAHGLAEGLSVSARLPGRPPLRVRRHRSRRRRSTGPTKSPSRPTTSRTAFR